MDYISQKISLVLGYRNLMRIIELIDYVEKYPDGDKHSKLNLYMY